MRMALPGRSVQRGVYVAPWMGEGGELVLLAITSHQRLAAPPLELRPGEDRVAASDRLWDALERVDPDPKVKLRAI